MLWLLSVLLPTGHIYTLHSLKMGKIIGLYIWSLRVPMQLLGYWILQHPSVLLLLTYIWCVQFCWGLFTSAHHCFNSRFGAAGWFGGSTGLLFCFQYFPGFCNQYGLPPILFMLVVILNLLCSVKSHGSILWQSQSGIPTLEHIHDALYIPQSGNNIILYLAHHIPHCGCYWC